MCESVYLMCVCVCVCVCMRMCVCVRACGFMFVGGLCLWGVYVCGGIMFVGLKKLILISQVY